MDLYKNSEITVHELKKRLDLDKNIQILDVREDSERKHVAIKQSIHIKLSELEKRYLELKLDENVFVMCHTGVRSHAVVSWLKSKGYINAVNVLGGIDAWSALVDTSLRRY
ncbi:MAG: Thiosulfate sulfurtransferase GlpE [Alphaproteobacteria bacterium MarineAlpha5_Bin11]|nr:sulfurtransferase [Pelagibacteraceae bacterium]PPR44168.1 MAG: Thiosulfate sulfurtransferase GlpE [Alphaproteobacteria bacterium MarineAlpha5_Bin11]|tara:strand:+ start:698 stop:1030 length:333 start_codon:yes stop_codon:yes gene_type:complete